MPDDFDGRQTDTRLLAPLDADIAAADVIVLGELNHFVHEKSDFRQFFSRYLISRGVAHFAEELGWSDGVRVANFLRGNDAALSRLPSFGYRGHERTDRDDRPTGILRPSFDAYPTSLFLAEQSRFYRELRSSGQKSELQYFGFDIDGSPGGSYEDIDLALAPLTKTTRLASFLSTLARVPGENVREEAERLERVRGLLEPLSGIVPAEVLLHVRVALNALIDSLRYVDLTYGAQSYDALRPGMALREDAMKRRIADVDTLRGAGSALVLMGHALHLVKNDKALRPTPGSVGPGGGLTTSLGHHLAQEKRKRLFSIWFVYGAGEDSQPFPDLPSEAHYPMSSINAAFSSSGRPFVLRTNDAMFHQPVKLGHMYNAIVELSLADQVDAIFFLPRVTKLQPIA